MKRLTWAWFFAGIFAPTSWAETVTITLTGTISYGYDISNTLGAGTTLDNAPFTLTFVLNDSQGVNSTGSCSDGSSLLSSNTGLWSPYTTTGNASLPPVVTFQVGSGSLFTFGRWPLYSA